MRNTLPVNGALVHYDVLVILTRSLSDFDLGVAVGLSENLDALCCYIVDLENGQIVFQSRLESYRRVARAQRCTRY